MQTEDELHSTRKQAAQLQTKSKKLKTENCELKVGLSIWGGLVHPFGP